ncbi:MAG: class I SAM-dependent methyltransferase [bacterium]|nr:class I SAM-dependent methyltransferase [bacterium]
MSIESPEFEIKSEEEKAKEETFQRYLVGLDLGIEQLKDKKILDLGCGEGGEFIKECINRGITQEIYGMDSAIKTDNVDEKYKKNILQGDFEAEFPINDLDYVISVGAIDPSFEIGDKRDPQKTILSSLKSLKDDGEMRIFPIRNAAPESGLEGIIELRKKWLEIMNKISLQELVGYELKPIQTRVSVNKSDSWTEEVLIIRKRKTHSLTEK